MALPLASGVFSPVAPGDRPAFWAVTGRLGGYSVDEFSQANIAHDVGDNPQCVQRNRDALAALVNVAEGNLAYMKPAHGNVIAEVVGGGTFAGIDSLVTDTCDVGLVAMGADCVPLIFYGSRGPEKSIIGAVHCGWKGLVAGVITRTVAKLRVQGAGEIQSVIGPAICGNCYSVTPDRRELVHASTPPSVSDAALGGTAGIDVRAGVLAQLSIEGVTSVVIGGCTFENPETLFSYRRENRTGRQGIIIVMRDNEKI